MHSHYLLIFLFMFSGQTLAFDNKKCDQLITGKGGYNRLGLSTSQFTSSFGECSLLGINDEEARRLYYSVNWSFIKEDVARGKGENLEVLINLSSCKDELGLDLLPSLKSQFQKIFVKDVDKSYENFSRVLEQSCQLGLKG